MQPQDEVGLGEGRLGEHRGAVGVVLSRRRLAAEEVAVLLLDEAADRAERVATALPAAATSAFETACGPGPISFTARTR